MRSAGLICTCGTCLYFRHSLRFQAFDATSPTLSNQGKLPAKTGAFDCAKCGRVPSRRIYPNRSVSRSHTRRDASHRRPVLASAAAREASPVIDQQGRTGTGRPQPATEFCQIETFKLGDPAKMHWYTPAVHLRKACLSG